jgi:hypothetical protein
MRTILVILWVQVALGVLGSFLAFSQIHMSAMGRAWSFGMRSEYDKARQAPDYHESSAIQGYTTARFIDAMETNARRRGEIAFGAFIGSMVASVFAVSLLLLLHRARVQDARLPP